MNALKTGKTKLLNIIQFEDLPNDRNDSLWLEIRKECGLNIGEVSALKNAVCSVTNLSVRALIMEGNKLLPELLPVGSTPTTVGSSHQAVRIVPGPQFRLCNLPDLSDYPSSLLVRGNYDGHCASTDYHNEASVEMNVLLMLEDILKALGLYNTLTVRQQATIDTRELGDVFVLTVFGTIVLVLVANRHWASLSEEKRLKCLGQPYDYMRTNRECFSLSYCFGVWITYRQCQIIWLNDDAHNNLASSTQVEVDHKFELPPNEYHWQSRQVCASKTFNKEDNIPRVMACLVWKLYNSQLQSKSKITRELGVSPPKFRAVNREGYFFQTNTKAISQLSFSMPGAGSSLFYLLKQHNGRDGKAWIAANRYGHLAVVKFRRSTKIFNRSKEKFKFLLDVDEDVDEIREPEISDEATAEVEAALALTTINDAEVDENATRAEMKAWQRVFDTLGVDVKTFVTTLAGREALVIPFIFTFDFNGRMWTELSHYIPCEDSFGGDMMHWEQFFVQHLQHFSDSSVTVKTLFAAITNLAKGFVYHKDIKWEHLGLLTVFDSRGVPANMVPVLIDLAEIQYCATFEAAWVAMCNDVMETVLSESQKTEFSSLIEEYRRAER